MDAVARLAALEIETLVVGALRERIEDARKATLGCERPHKAPLGDGAYPRNALKNRRIRNFTKTRRELGGLFGWWTQSAVTGLMTVGPC